uniref:Uncharacterized protein n=1 Tax=viral metagenome TaxID=1070528 RepID=A0A6M3JQN6_9ZZZZ
MSDKEQIMILLRELSKRLELTSDTIKLLQSQHLDDLNLIQQLADIITEEKEVEVEVETEDE